MQCHFPTGDVLLRSGDIRDQVAKLSEIASKFQGPRGSDGMCTTENENCLPEYNRNVSAFLVISAYWTFGLLCFGLFIVRPFEQLPIKRMSGVEMGVTV